MLNNYITILLFELKTPLIPEGYFSRPPTTAPRPQPICSPSDDLHSGGGGVSVSASEAKEASVAVMLRTPSRIGGRKSARVLLLSLSPAVCRPLLSPLSF